MSVSLDGFIETADGDIRWSAPDEELHRHFNNLEGTINLHLYGRWMYETMAAYWPTADRRIRTKSRNQVRLHLEGDEEDSIFKDS